MDDHARPPQYGPSLMVAKLWVGTSAKGTRKLGGLLGGARVTVLPNTARESDADHSHVMLLSQADPSWLTATPPAIPAPVEMGSEPDIDVEVGEHDQPESGDAP